MDLSSARWRKSSYSGNQTACVEVAPVQLPDDQWRKSSYSGNQTNCVEVAPTRAATGVRDSKNRSNGYLLFPHQPWSSFVAAVKAAAIDGR